MKVLQVITSLHTGGAETLVVNMIPRLRALGAEVDLCVFDGTDTPLMQRAETLGCHIYKLGRKVYNPLYIWKLMRLMRHYDIVHTHNSSPQLFVALANMVCRKKLVTTEHSTNNRKREAGGLLKLMDKWMYRQYHRTVCISVIAEEKLETYLGIQTNTERICTINNGVDVEAFHTAVPLEREKDRRFVVVMVAGFREAKDQDTLIRAISLLPEDKYALWLVGDGVRRSELEHCISECRAENQVCLWGLRSDVPAILKAADVVVMSSHWEGLSLSNIEGMSVGKPFLASDVNGLREITSGYGLLFPHGDAEALAKIIRRLAEDKSYYDEVAAKCYERARQFDISTTVEEYYRIYQKLKK